MTHLVRIIHDQGEADDARMGAAFEFLDEMDRDPDAGRKVAPAMIEQWWGVDFSPAHEPEPDPDDHDLWQRSIP